MILFDQRHLKFFPNAENNLDKLLDCGLRNVLKAARSAAQYQSMCV
jgi:hypothetical protein